VSFAAPWVLGGLRRWVRAPVPREGAWGIPARWGQRRGTACGGSSSSGLLEGMGWDRAGAPRAQQRPPACTEQHPNAASGSLSPSKPHLQSTNSTGISRATPKCVSSPAQLGDADHVPSPVWHRMGFPPGWWISSGSPFAAWLAPLALGRLPEALQSNCWLWQTGAKQIDSCSVILRAGGSWTIIVLNCIILEKLFPRLLQRTGQAELGFSCCL